MTDSAHFKKRLFLKQRATEGFGLAIEKLKNTRVPQQILWIINPQKIKIITDPWKGCTSFLSPIDVGKGERKEKKWWKAMYPNLCSVDLFGASSSSDTQIRGANQLGATRNPKMTDKTQLSLGEKCLVTKLNPLHEDLLETTGRKLRQTGMAKEKLVA